VTPRRLDPSHSSCYVWYMDSPAEFKDGLISGPTRGRGAGLNPGNRFKSVRLHVLGEHLEELAVEHPEGAKVPTRIYADPTPSPITRAAPPALAMNWPVNPSRGCEHGCFYSSPRPGHEYLGLSSGLDFETRIFAKLDAPGILRDELAAPKWQGEPIS